MPKLLTPDPDAAPAQVRCPLGGDKRKALSVEVGLQDLANQVAATNRRHATVIEITETGTWTKPAWLALEPNRLVTFECCGGGGGGGGSKQGIPSYQSGGGGSGYVSRLTVRAADVDASVDCYVGGGGAGGTGEFGSGSPPAATPGADGTATTVVIGPTVGMFADGGKGGGLEAGGDGWSGGGGGNVGNVAGKNGGGGGRSGFDGNGAPFTGGVGTGSALAHSGPHGGAGGASLTFGGGSGGGGGFWPGTAGEDGESGYYLDSIPVEGGKGGKGGNGYGGGGGSGGTAGGYSGVGYGSGSGGAGADGIVVITIH